MQARLAWVLDVDSGAACLARQGEVRKSDELVEKESDTLVWNVLISLWITLCTKKGCETCSGDIAYSECVDR